MALEQAFCIGEVGTLFVGVRVEHEEEGTRTFAIPVDLDETEDALLDSLEEEWGDNCEVILLSAGEIANCIASGIELCSY